MNTNTDILRNNFSLSHRSINQKKWNYEQMEIIKKKIDFLTNIEKSMLGIAKSFLR